MASSDAAPVVNPQSKNLDAVVHIKPDTGGLQVAEDYVAGTEVLEDVGNIGGHLATLSKVPTEVSLGGQVDAAAGPRDNILGRYANGGLALVPLLVDPVRGGGQQAIQDYEVALAPDDKLAELAVRARPGGGTQAPGC